ncbi:MAG: hypothetical protein NW237_02460 [Cyanobacteriota bacterium]|nr:hypothetical protein [Cyanobacteriota bacterium]
MRIAWLMTTIVGLTALLPGDPAWGQLRLVPAAVEQVYASLPQLPLENTYTPSSPEAGDPTENTLVKRLMLYHLQVKGRSPSNRLDWKLTLADYLEANEPMVAQEYPGASLFRENPYHRDRQHIQALSRSERASLLNALLTAFGGDPTPPILYIPPSATAGSPERPTTPIPAETLLIPPPGNADLLKP